MAPRRGWASPRGSGSFQRQRLGIASSDSHVGARHRRRCVDLVLRLDFDGAWHRPARSLRCTDFDAPISPSRSPRARLSEVPGIPIRQRRPSDSSRWGESACLASSRGARRRTGAQRRTPIADAAFPNSSTTARPTIAPSRSGWAGVFVLRSSGLVLRSVTGTVTGSGSGGRRISLLLVPCSVLPRGRGIRLRLRLRRDKSRILHLAS